MRRTPKPRFQLVSLEDRCTPATFTATTFQDLLTTGVDLTTGKLPTGEITLRSAILAANATAGMDAVVAPAGTYLLTLKGAGEDGGATGDLDVTDNVALQLTGAILDGTGLDDRVLNITAANATVSINGGTIQNGKLATVNEQAFGGGILNQGTLTLNNVAVIQNQAIGADSNINSFGAFGAFGGGIASFGALTITGGEVRANTATGGSALTDPGSPGGNGSGGGILLRDSATLQATGTRITGNIAIGGPATGSGEGNGGGRGLGGGVYVDSFAGTGVAVTLTGVRIDTNQALGGSGANGATGGEGRGGGFGLNGTGASVLNSTFDANLAKGGNGIGNNDTIAGAFGGEAFGGGISTDDSGASLTLENSTISGNQAIGGDATNTITNAFRGQAIGGGIYLSGFSSTSLIGSATITDNEVLAGNGDDAIVTIGGGLANAGVGVTHSVRGSIIAGNRAPANPDVANFARFSTAVPFTSLGSNLIGASDGTQGFMNAVNNDQVGSLANPIDALLTPLANFGGSSLALVHALNIGSPARDKGNAGTLTTDQRGTGFLRATNSAADVGAFEVQIPASLAQSVTGPVVAGQPFLISASVTDPRFQPTGTVTFVVNGNVAGTAMLDPSGNASIMATVANAGPFTVGLDYNGDAAYLEATAADVTFTAIATTTTTAGATPNPQFATQPVTLTALVAPSAPGTPTGTVQFAIDGTTFGSPVVIDANGNASLPVPAGFAAGSYQVSAVYSGDANFNGSNGTATLVVNQIPTTTTVNAAPNPVFATDPIVFSADVAGQTGGTPTGTVTFLVDGASIATVAVDANGQATFTLDAGLEVGDDGMYTITANYSGDATFVASSAPSVTLTVNPVPTRTTLTAVPTTAFQGTAIDLTANVQFAPLTAAQNRAAGINPAILNGTVDFFNGTTLLGSAPVNNGVATLTTTSLPVGTNALTAVFVPATNNLTSSTGSTSVTIAQRANIQEIFAVSSGYGIITTVIVYDPDGNEITRFLPFGPGFWCGAVVATGDVTGDGIEDVIVGGALSAGPHVKVYDGVNFQVIDEFFAFDPAFRGGVNLAAGDLTGDGVAEIVTGAGLGGGPQVNVYSFVNGNATQINSFFAYDPSLRSGVNVAVSDGLLATGPGFQGGPHVRVFSGPGTREVASFFANLPDSRDGVNVALSFNGTQTVLTVGLGAGAPPVANIFDPTTGAILDVDAIYEQSYVGGVSVTNVNTAAGESRRVFGTGLGGGPRVRLLRANDSVVRDFFAFDESFRGGVFVG